MSHPSIRVKGLGKQYVIGGRETGQENFREMLTSGFAAPFRRFRKLRGEVSEKELIWALKDVNFEVAEAEVVGFIGRNGAGKSTLLKILSRITEPTEGRVEIRGRVSSLLEVGTGFHLELTGRENIYLNAAILGMGRAEIDRKFDEIVSFAGVERFLDTPVKRYSSGMSVRLAFAIAAHLEPDILVVDEVLAVGDAEFQKKCLGKMKDVAGHGRTVLFVSHNMAAIENLCSRCIFIDKGRVHYDGEVNSAINVYTRTSQGSRRENLRHRSDRQGIGDVQITGISINSCGIRSSETFPVGSDLTIIVRYLSSRSMKKVRAIIGVYDFLNTGILRFDSDLSGSFLEINQGSGTLICKTAPITVTPGTYFVNIAVLENGSMQDHVDRAAYVTFEPSDFFGTGRFFSVEDLRLTKVLVNHSWAS